jgi:hypothetical protein
MNDSQDNNDDGGGGGTEPVEQIARQQQGQQRQRKLKNVISILEQRDEFPALIRNNIDDLVDGSSNKSGMLFMIFSAVIILLVIRV